MVLYEIYREDGGNGITFVHMLYIYIYQYPWFKSLVCRGRRHGKKSEYKLQGWAGRYVRIVKYKLHTRERLVYHCQGVENLQWQNWSRLFLSQSLRRVDKWCQNWSRCQDVVSFIPSSQGVDYQLTEHHLCSFFLGVCLL
jgi:hypothetical protein